MTLRIRLLEATGPSPDNAYSRGSNALELGALHVTLRFVIDREKPEELEALLHARRSILREEWTRGRDGQEPSLEDAVFSTDEISWRIRPDQRAWCLEKIEELVRRANRALHDRSTL